MSEYKLPKEEQTIEAISNRLGIEEYQVRNLIRLAKTLFALPEEYEKFDMEVYLVDVEKFTVKYPSFSEVYPEMMKTKGCGTAACAIGHSFTVPNIERLEDHKATNFSALSSHLYGDDETYSNLSIFFGSFCFSSSWSDYDNTAKGAAQRITYILTHDFSDEHLDKYKKILIPLYNNLEVTDLPYLEK